MQPAFFQFSERAASRLKQAMKLSSFHQQGQPAFYRRDSQYGLPGIYPRSPSLNMKERRARSPSRIGSLGDLFKEFPGAAILAFIKSKIGFLINLGSQFFF